MRLTISFDGSVVEVDLQKCKTNQSTFLSSLMILVIFAAVEWKRVSSKTDLGSILGEFWTDLGSLGNPNGHEKRYISREIHVLPPGSLKGGFREGSGRVRGGLGKVLGWFGRIL